MKPDIKDILVVSLTAAITAIASIMLYVEFTAGAETTSTEPIGKIIYKKKKTQRKYTNQVIWEDVSQYATVYNYDTIRTDADSASILQLKDGSEIELNENTLILVSLSGDRAAIDFSQGAISANSSGSLSISAGGAVIDTKKSSINLRAGGPGSGISVNVQSGSAKIGGTELDSGKKALITESSADIQEKAFIPISPSENMHIVTSQKSYRVDFSWKKAAEKVSARFELSDKPDFSRLIARVNQKVNTYSVVLQAGSYYWRVLPDGRTADSVNSAAFTVISDRAQSAVSPSNGSSVSSAGGVALSWIGSEYASSYEVTISSRRDFSENVRKISSTLPRITVPDFAEGTYYWKIRNIYPYLNQGGSVESAPASFNALGAEKLLPPKPVNPENRVTLSAVQLSHDGLMFSWKSEYAFQKYLIEVSDSEDFSNPVIRAELPGTYYLSRARLASGSYLWRITAFSAGKDVVSENNVFTVVPSLPIRAISPSDGGSVNPAEGAGNVKFSWLDPNRARGYTLDISADRDFKEILHSETVSQSSLTYKPESYGLHYWRVRTSAASPELSVSSPAFSFIITGKTPPPKLLYPSESLIVDMSSLNSLNFRWEASAGASVYRLSLKQYTGLTPRTVFKTEVKGTRFSFRELEKLDEGNFVAELEAVRMNGSSVSDISPAATVHFTITLKSALSNPNFISPRVIYVR